MNQAIDLPKFFVGKAPRDIGIDGTKIRQAEQRFHLALVEDVARNISRTPKGCHQPFFQAVFMNDQAVFLVIRVVCSH